MTTRRSGEAREHGRFDVPRGAFVLAAGVPAPGALPVLDAVERVLADWRRQEALGNVAALTLDKGTAALRRFARFAFAYGAESLTDVDGALCQRWCEALKSHGKGHVVAGRGERASLGTSHNRKGMLRAFFVTCQALGLDDRDPSVAVSLPARPNTRYFRPLTDTEAAECLRVSRRRAGETRLPVTVGLSLMGVTTAELPALRVRDCWPAQRRVWAHGGGTRTAPRWVALDAPTAAAVTARVAYLTATVPAEDLPDALLVYSPRNPGTSPEKRQAAVCGQLGTVLRLAGLGDDEGLRPGAFVEHAAVRIFAETASLPRVAAALGMASLDAAADALGHDWRTANRVPGPPGVPDPATPVTYAGVVTAASVALDPRAQAGTGRDGTTDRGAA